MSMNFTLIEGRLTRDPETRNVGNTSVTKFTVACDRNFKKNDEWQKETTVVDCEAWGRQGEKIAAAGKGAPVVVEGRLKQESWERDGKKQSKLLVVANAVLLIKSTSDDSAPCASDGLNYDRPLRQPNEFDAANNNVGVSYDVPF